MKGVISASVSPGSSQRETRVTCTPMVMVPSCAAGTGVAVWDLAARQLTRLPHGGIVRDLCLTGDGRWLVTVNTFRSTHWMLPYGGYKMSGLGRENGLEALHHYTEVKTVVVDFDAAPPADPFLD